MLTPIPLEVKIKMWKGGVRADASDNLRALIDRGWRETYAACFGQEFVSGLAPHHIEALSWHWDARILFLTGKYPEYDAYFPIWSRAHFKSGIARRIAIIEGLLNFAYGRPAYILYLSRNKVMALKHSKSIETLLQSNRLRAICPELSQEQQNEQKRSKGWTASFIYTKANVIFHFAGLEEGMAGGNLETSAAEEAGDDRLSDVRVTQFIFDDIDGREDSPTIAESRFQALTGEVLPMGQDNTLTFFAQNLISRYSTMYRIYKQQSRVLTGRKPTEPIPAVLNFVSEQRTTKDGLIQDVYVSGEPTWSVWDARRIQQEINRFGLPAFNKECQHLVEQDKTGLMIHNYNDNIHPISLSEFESVFGVRSMPVSWPKEWGNDWARTKTAKHANVALWRTVSSQNSKLPGFMFYFHPMSFPANSPPADVAERVLSCLSPYVEDVRPSRFNPQADNGRPKQTWTDLRRDALMRANALEHTNTDLERFEFERAVLQDVFSQYTVPLLAKHHVAGGVNSHERDDIRKIYNEVYALQCQAVNPGKFGGIEQINNEFAIDDTLAHPFRPDVKGYTRTFVVCPDDTSQDAVVINDTLVYPPEPFPENLTPDDLHDDKLFRYQMKNCRLAAPKLTETGERIDEPLKMDDDFIDCLKMLAVTGQLPNEPLTVHEEFEMLVGTSVLKPDPATGTVQMTKELQMKLDHIRWNAEEQLKEKYGDTELFDTDDVEVDNEEVVAWWN